MLFLPFPKATLLVPSGPDSDPDCKHLFIVLTAPNAIDLSVLKVGVSSVPSTGNHDPTCELFRGDHPFIRHPSYIRYRDAVIIEAQKLIDGVASGALIAKDPLSDDIMARVVYGIETSPFVAPKVLAYYLAHR